MDVMGIANIILITFGLVGYLIYHHYTRFDALLKRSIEDVKEGRVHRFCLEDFKKEQEETEKWKKEHPNLSFLKDAYWYIRHFIYELPELPRYGYRKIKRGIQRAYRGWADEDTWYLNHYLSKVIKESVTRLYKYDICFKIGNTGDNDKDYDLLECKKVLEDIIYAFKINEDICNGDREMYMPKLNKKLREEWKCLTLKEEMRRRTGMRLFNQYFLSLWD